MAKKKVVRKKILRKKKTTAHAATAVETTTSSPRRSSSRTRTRSKKSRDLQTISRINKVAELVEHKAAKQQDPFVDIPTRALSNTNWNKKRRILEMGSNSQRRNLFNLNQAKKFMQTMLMSSACKELIEADKTLSLRGMYYKSLHTIEGTKEKTFAGQEESDPILEDL